MTVLEVAGERELRRFVPPPAKRPPPYFPYIEIARFSGPNVSSRRLRRNNFVLHETIFRLSCRRPETLAH
jgi:hypothetical protein